MIVSNLELKNGGVEAIAGQMLERLSVALQAWGLGGLSAVLVDHHSFICRHGDRATHANDGS